MLSRFVFTATKSSMIARSFASAAFALPPLPYGKKDLEPAISENTIKCHYDGHHQTYVNNLNNMTKDGERKSLEYYITDVKGPVHNQAAQVYPKLYE